MQAFIDQAQSSAMECGGYCTWPFSQLTEPVATIFASHPDTVTGLCEMLSARWIERHANGSSLVSWLSTASGDIDRSKVRQLRICPGIISTFGKKPPPASRCPLPAKAGAGSGRREAGSG